MTSRTLRLLPSPYALENLYIRLGSPAWFWPSVGGVLLGLLVLGSSVADDAHADLLPDAVEIPVATRHLEHNDRLRNDTPGVVADEKLCKKQPDGLHVTSCAVWLGLRGEW